MIDVISSKRAEPPLVRLVGSVEIGSAAELHSLLRDLVTNRQRAVIDCAALESLDTACIQLLWAAKRELGDLLRIEVVPGGDISQWLKLAGVSHQLVGGTNSSDDESSSLHSDTTSSTTV